MSKRSVEVFRFVRTWLAPVVRTLPHRIADELRETRRQPNKARAPRGRLRFRSQASIEVRGLPAAP